MKGVVQVNFVNASRIGVPWAEWRGFALTSSVSLILAMAASTPQKWYLKQSLWLITISAPWKKASGAVR